MPIRGKLQEDDPLLQHPPHYLHELPKEEEERFEKLFIKLDRGGDGKIDIEDLSHALKEFGLHHRYAELTKNQNIQPQSKSRGTTKSLAELHQRKQEVLCQLENIFGKHLATVISNNATTLARQESELDSPTSPYTFWTLNSGPTFVRSDSILAEDDYVPYEAKSCVNKYGPISRMHKENVGVNQNVQTNYKDGSLPTSLQIRKPVSAANSVNPYYYNNPQFHQASITAGHTLVASPGAGLGDGYLIGTPQLIFQRMHDPSKELIAESQRVKLQLRNLEKQLNDLKLATQGATNRFIEVYCTGT